MKAPPSSWLRRTTFAHARYWRALRTRGKIKLERELEQKMLQFKLLVFALTVLLNGSSSSKLYCRPLAA